MDDKPANFCFTPDSELQSLPTGSPRASLYSSLAMRDTDSLSLCRTCREDLAHLWETWETGHVRETTDHGGVVLATHNHSNLSSQSCPICAILKDHIREIVDNAQRSGKRIDLSDLKWTITTTKSPLARFIIVFRFSSSQFDWLHLNCYLDAGRRECSHFLALKCILCRLLADEGS
jgi:hypothetical protein